MTEREAEILDLMGEGLSTEQIAGKLFVAKVTVRSPHRGGPSQIAGQGPETQLCG